MSVIQGNDALASDYNTLRTAVNKWFSDNYSGVSFGDPNQTYGYGGAGAASVSAGDDMLASNMDELRDRCNIGVNVTSVTGSLSDIAPDDDILATDYNDTESKSNSINSNRLNIDAGELSLLSGGSSIRSTSYAAAVDCIFRYTQSSFSKSRYFWNTGGAVNIYGIITGYSTGTGYDGAGINEILSTMGTVTMDHTQTIQSGSGGVPSSIGFYDLTTSWQSIFTQTGSGAYSDATLAIHARRNTSGSYVEVRVTITPESGRTVDGTTTIISQYRKLDNQASGGESLTITAPTPSVQDNL